MNQLNQSDPLLCQLFTDEMINARSSIFSSYKYVFFTPVLAAGASNAVSKCAFTALHLWKMYTFDQVIRIDFYSKFNRSQSSRL